MKARRIAVVGNSGSGKTTLAREIASRLGCDHIELDSIHHLPNWTPIDRDEMRAVVADRIKADTWVVDGNYQSVVQDIVLPEADAVAWLDLPRRIVISRIVRRTLGRMALRRELWNGNRERFRNLFAADPRENIVLWSITHHNEYRRQYENAMTDSAYRHLQWFRFTANRQVREWLETL
jgi:adenylate kinase family enzyme